MKPIFYSLIILFCVACEPPRNNSKENLKKIKDSITTQDTISQTSTQKETAKTVKLLSGKQLLDSLLKKAKYRDLKKIMLPSGFALGYWHTDSSKESLLSPMEFESLTLKKFQHQDFHRIYLYAYLGKNNNKHLFLILRPDYDGGSASDLWMVDSLGKIIDIQEYVAYGFGDAGFVGEGYTNRLNDTTFITNRKFGDVLGNVFILTNTHFIIRKDSFFVKKVDTLAYKKPKF